jgi:hypothetical protein
MLLSEELELTIFGLQLCVGIWLSLGLTLDLYANPSWVALCVPYVFLAGGSPGVLPFLLDIDQTLRDPIRCHCILVERSG